MTHFPSYDDLYNLYNFPNCNLPQLVREKLDNVSQKSYSEIYEPVIGQDISLQESLEDILKAVRYNANSLYHIQYVWMALILTLVVKNTVEFYQPNNPTPGKIIQKMESWLLTSVEAGINPEAVFKQAVHPDEIEFSIDFDVNLAPALGSFQAWYEASNVFENALKTLDPNLALDALLEILEDCLEGYAIFPGSAGRRDLLNWWLFDVVPAAWCLRAPTSMYLVEGVQVENEVDVEALQLRQLKRLQDICSHMRSIIQQAIENQIELDSITIRF